MSELKNTSFQKKFSGAYGFVIKPDEKTQKVAEFVARQLAPNAEYKVIDPHVTLYHSQFERLPKEVVKAKLDELRKYEGTQVLLKDLQVFGGKYIFWNIKKTDTLSSMHKSTLETASFLDQKAVADAIVDGLDLDQKEIEYTKEFGYPLALEKYLPHITLAFDSKGLKLSDKKRSQIQPMTIGKIVFCEMGKYGRVKEVIDLYN